MDKIMEFLKGKKTYLLVLVYVVLVLATGRDGPVEDSVLGVDADALKEAVLGLMIATGKAAFDRFTKR